MAVTLQFLEPPRDSLDQQMVNGEFDRFVLIVPTKRRIRHLTREIIASLPGCVAPSIHIYTLETLAEMVFRRHFPGRKFLSTPARTLAFHNAIHGRQQQLSYFSLRGAGSALPRGTFEKIIDVILTLKDSGIYPDVLLEEIPLAEFDERRKLEDIAAIYSGYEQALVTISGTDAPGVFKALHMEISQPQFNRAFRSTFPRIDHISIAGFDEFTEPQIGFIRKLCNLNDISISLIFDFLRGNAQLFGHLEENYRRFREMGFVDRQGNRSSTTMHVVPPEAPSGQIQKLKEAIALQLFTGTTQTMAASEFITLARAPDREQEVDLVCKIIKDLQEKHPTELSRICVAARRPEIYTEMFRERFPKYGIPANITDRFALARAPVVVSILDVLLLATRNFRRDDVLKVVASPHFEFRHDGDILDRNNLRRVCQRIRPATGIPRWLGRIDEHLKGIDAKKEVAAGLEGERYRFLKEYRQLEKARVDIEWLGSLVHIFQGDMEPVVFRRNLLSVLETLDVPANLLRGQIAPETAEIDARAYAKFLEVLEEMTRLLEYQEGAAGSHPLGFYVEQLKVALSQERYNVRERFGQGVLVTSIEETRGLSIDVMIVIGMVDGEFPSPYQPEVFLSAARQKLRDQRYTWENRYLFYQAITNWREHLYLTYPEQDADLDLVRSSFIDALTAIVEPELWHYPDGVPFHNIMYSEEELLEAYGRSALPVQENDHSAAIAAKLKAIRRGVDIERSRTSSHVFPEYEGVLWDALPAAMKEKLENLRQQVFSVSQLETYGACPFRFFAERLLRLDTPDDLTEELSPREKGSVLHEILFEFFSRRAGRSLPSIAKCNEEQYAVAMNDLLTIAEKRIHEIDIADAFWDFEKELILGDKDATTGLLNAFLRNEREQRHHASPEFFEVSFGMPSSALTMSDSRLSTESPVTAGAIHLRGKVDRIEIAERSFTIVDYKTGKKIPSFDEIKGGLSLQLPLYLHAVETLLQAYYDGKFLSPAAGIYYKLHDDVRTVVGIGSKEHCGEAFEETGRRKGLVATDEALREIIDSAIALATHHVLAMSEGKFPVTTPDKMDKVCKYCHYDTVCRIKTMRQSLGTGEVQ